MAIDSVDIDLDLSDYLGVDYDPRRAKIRVVTNIESDTIVDTSDGSIRVGSGSVTLGDNGTGTASVWIPGVDSNPETWQTSFLLSYPDKATNSRKTRTFGPFTITAAAALGDLVEEQEIPPAYLTTVTALLDEYVDDAEAAAIAAEAARDAAIDISNIATPDALVETLVLNTGGAGPLTSAALSNTIASRAGVVIKPAFYGAIADGSTDDAVALAATLTAAAAASVYGLVRVDLDGKRYLTGTRLQMPSDVELFNGTILSSVATASGGIIQFQPDASGWILRELTIDIGLANTGLLAGTSLLNNCVYLSGTQHDGLIEDCTFIGSKNQSIDILTSAYNVTIRRCKFSDIKGGIHVYEGAYGITIEDNDFTRWHGIAVYVDGTATAGPSGVKIARNTFHDPSPYATTAGGFVARQSIVAIGDIASPIRSLSVVENVIEGPEMPFSDATTTDSDLATGDQITLWYCDEFLVHGNMSFGGGENGISIVRGVRNGIVSSNVAARNDGHGIQVGRITQTAYNITVIGNVSFNNGLDANNEQDALAGLFMQDTQDCTIVGNTFYDDQGVPTQSYGVLFTNAVNTVYLGNQGHGNVLGNTSTPGGTTTFRQYWEDTTLRVGGPGVTQPRFVIDASSGQRRELRWNTDGVDRWRLYAGTAAETGLKAVTNKALTSNVATITTSTAHGMLAGATVIVSGVGVPFDGTYTVVSAPTTTTFTYAKTASDVASVAATGVANTGTNAGSNLFLDRYADAGGAVLGQVVTISRATGKATWASDHQFDGVNTGFGFPVVATKGSAQVYNNTTTLAAITSLSASVAANTTTEVKFILILDGDAAADFKVAPVIPAGATVDWWVTGGSAAVGATGPGTGQWLYGDETTTSIPIGTAAVGTKVVAVVTCRVTTTGTAGTVTLTGAQNTATATDTTVAARSTVQSARVA